MQFRFRPIGSSQPPTHTRPSKCLNSCSCAVTHVDGGRQMDEASSGLKRRPSDTVPRGVTWMCG
jgi:hypothetical protein